MSAEVKEGRKKRKEEKEGRKGRKKRKEGRPGSTSGTRARVAWSRAARETSEARQPVGPYWCERSQTGARRASALNRQDVGKKRLGSPEGQTPPVGLEPHTLWTRSRTPCPSGQGGASDGSWQGSQSSGCGRPLRTSSGENKMRPERFELPTF